MPLSDLETVCICKPTSSARDSVAVGISRYKRDVPPADYLFKIQSYSLLVETEVEKFESNYFDVGGYKWKLILYPSGNSKSNGKDHISLYLAIGDRSNFSRGWEVNINFKLFVFDKKNNNYLTIQDTDGALQKFNEMKTEWGYDQLISLKTLFDSSNGYLVNDSCVFGAELLVIRNSGKWESLSMVKDPPRASLTWKLEKFSTLDRPAYLSDSIYVGGIKWQLMVYPKGSYGDDVKGKYLSLFLTAELDNFELSNRTVYASFKLKILDQLNKKHHEKTVKKPALFRNVLIEDQRGYDKFISLSELNKAANGYIKDNAIIMELQFLQISMVKISS